MGRTYTIDRTERGMYVALRHYDMAGLAMRPPALVGLEPSLRDAKEAAQRDAELGGGE